jgi:hypothetical protein
MTKHEKEAVRNTRLIQLTTYRVCLICDRCFPSIGPDHRICDEHKTAPVLRKVSAARQE